MKKIVYATTNRYKLSGANRALAGTGIELLAPESVLPDIPEIQSDSQKEVSVDKAIKYYAFIKTPIIVMDSGLFIDNLGGFPGVYTKYALATVGMDKIASLFSDGETFTAYTQRVITYFDGSRLKTFSSKIKGTIITQPRGQNGKDYDTYFMIGGQNKTIAELSDDEQTKMISPVWKELAEWLLK